MSTSDEKKYIMSMDCGTTSNRCIIFNEKGEMCAVAQKEFTQYFPKPGWVEHDANEIWDTQLLVCRQAMEQLKITYKNIAAIGITNQRETTIVWDKKTGQEKYKSLTKYFYKDSKIAIMVYDISEKSTFDELKNFWLGQIQEYGAKDTIFWVIGNKSDLYIQEEVSENEGKQFAESIGASFKQTSAKNNLGIKDLFQEIGEACVKSRKGERRKTIKLNKKDYEEPQEEVEEKKEKKKKKCCNGH